MKLDADPGFDRVLALATADLTAATYGAQASGDTSFLQPGGAGRSQSGKDLGGGGLAESALDGVECDHTRSMGTRSRRGGRSMGEVYEGGGDRLSRISSTRSGVGE